MSKRKRPAPPPDLGSIWVITEPGVFGDSYHPVIQVGPHRAFSPADPLAYAATAARAIEYACYQSAVARQLVAAAGRRGGDAAEHAQAAMEVVAHLRAAAPRPDDAATAPLVFQPVVSGNPGRNYAPSVHVYCDGEPITQWDRADVYSHLFGVMSAYAVADLDTAYRAVLIRSVQLDPGRIGVMIDDLRNWRDAGPESLG